MNPAVRLRYPAADKVDIISTQHIIHLKIASFQKQTKKNSGESEGTRKRDDWCCILSSSKLVVQQHSNRHLLDRQRNVINGERPIKWHIQQTNHTLRRTSSKQEVMSGQGYNVGDWRRTNRRYWWYIVFTTTSTSEAGCSSTGSTACAGRLMMIIFMIATRRAEASNKNNEDKTQEGVE
jgi:hypothetical protein